MNKRPEALREYGDRIHAALITWLNDHRTERRLRQRISREETLDEARVARFEANLQRYANEHLGLRHCTWCGEDTLGSGTFASGLWYCSDECESRACDAEHEGCMEMEQRDECRRCAKEHGYPGQATGPEGDWPKCDWHPATASYYCWHTNVERLQAKPKIEREG